MGNSCDTCVKDDRLTVEVKGRPANGEGSTVASENNGSQKLTWPDGSLYEGDVKHGTMHGEGVYLWPNGDSYAGDWREGKRHGKGVFEFNGRFKYTGEFNNDEIQGFGKININGMTAYEGNFFKGQQHGPGTAYSVEHGIVKKLKGTWSYGQYIG